jgi:pyruvate/2-oxoglutarate dehydrogenase complex dihydrolipoamide dehydrogenase (E3) component
MEAVRARKRGIVDSFSDGSERGMRRHETLELIFGEARFRAPHVVDVRVWDGSERRLEAPHIFINVGTRPAVPPIDGLAHVPHLDSTSIMELDHVPDHLVILGGGFIGLEFAQMFRRFGSRVTVVEQADRIAVREDQDIVQALTAILEEDGIAFRLGAAVERVANENGGVALTIAGSAEPVRGSHLLVAVGRVPNSDNLGLDAAGIITNERGHIRVTDCLETNVPGVFALGDVNGGPPFTHVAYDDYRVVRAKVLDGDGQRTTRDRLLPYVVFTDPQLGRVGLTEAQARARGHRIQVARLPMTRVARAVETGETRGMIKAVVDADTQQILGAAVLGIEGGELVSILQTAMMGALPYTVLRDAVYAHPALAESLNNLFMSLDV